MIENPMVIGNWHDSTKDKQPRHIGICCGCESQILEDEHYTTNDNGLFIHDNDRDCYKLWFKNQ